MMRHQITINKGQQKLTSRHGFTLIEVLVALAIFSLLLVIILVPLNMGFTMLHLGKAQSDVQSATQEVVDRMRSDLTKAVYVFPNAKMPSVTNKSPYCASGAGSCAAGTGTYFGPYLQMSGVDTITSASPDAGATAGACKSSGGVANLSRIDMILAQTNGNSLITPVQPSYYLVSYYARRRDVTKPYQPIDNPIVLYRAQIPYYSPDATNPGYLATDGTVVAAGNNDVNADTSNNRYGNNCSDQGSWWLAESKYGEPNLQPLTDENGAANPAAAFIEYGSHVSMLPTDLGMATGVDYRGYNAQNQSVSTYTPPKSTFVCADTNNDGVIDEVRLTVLLQNATPSSSGSNGPQINLPQVVDLPNVRSMANIH